MQYQINLIIYMKYQIGDTVIFITVPNMKYSWKLNDYDEYIINKIAYGSEPEQVVYGVKDKYNTETTWFTEDTFVTLKEYRKIKLNKINGMR